ncbi:MULTISPECIES: NlpC/P60 family protein [unclassified Herbaspirillum]|jgi:cell wall-associated NlpC family hydrolase|uniref:C40 family peptidase n=1 Tax=unclassified Herbaspirillum TaxID=2624150 RepID=UPI000E2F2A95|nr:MULTISPECIES: NlpC/P60 family protein [unclassified Herbaspirillum]RFB73065.1 peptidoglycan endopeptidase [Herbaspirillum sp. 3R-3a1]TFI11124.1 peptidoglycan endopeptidase [Herbaspirillum sp. 3R11]TFI17032.1 peptidoglycan endopeptidase [Herbaspirillum sp. 3R-11]TFI31110.1 peptidoglycan endopeptidase [Herbaspirillum sp. 3C11]
MPIFSRRWLLPVLCFINAAACAAETPPSSERFVARAVTSLTSGIRYKFGGTDPDSGLDCSAFIALLYKDAGGGDLPRTAREISEVGAHIDAGALQPGDLVFFRNTQGGIAHVGIYVGGENFVHASRKHGVIYQSRLNEPYWKSRFKGARRLPQS